MQEKPKHQKHSGIILVDKAQEYTSHDVVGILRKTTGIKRIGHTGTLDPMATGLLPVCIGRATRIVEYMEPFAKEYRCTMRLGAVSDTYDIWGRVETAGDIGAISEADIAAAFSRYRGEIWQKPPMFSAKKVKGRKLYEYARQGQTVEVKPQRIFVERLDIESIDMTVVEVTFNIRCSKGTYIRSICHDIGRDLGCGAVMSALRRTRVGPFDVADAISIETIKHMSSEQIAEHMLPISAGLKHLPGGTVDKHGRKWFINGGELTANRVRPRDNDHTAGDTDRLSGIYVIYSEEGALLGTARWDESINSYRPHKVLYTENI